MKNFKVSKETVGNLVKVSCRVLGCALAVVLPIVSKRDEYTVVYSNTDVGYDDVIGAVMNSNMLSSYKVEIVSIVPKGESSSLYGALIQVIESDMLSSNKIEAIKHICEE